MLLTNRVHPTRKNRKISAARRAFRSRFESLARNALGDGTFVWPPSQGLREIERRHPDRLTAAWWKEERGQRIFIDFNQNAPHKTVFGAWSSFAGSARYGSG